MTARNKKIFRLAAEDPELHANFKAEQRKNDGFKHFAHASGRFPLTAFGRLNTYSLFAEHARTAMDSRGRSGQIVPSGIATDSFNQYFFKDLVTRGHLVALYGFENEEKVFPGVHHSVNFALFCMAGSGSADAPISIAFRVRQVEHLPTRAYSLTGREIQILNPNTGTCPVFRSHRDMEITLAFTAASQF